MVAFAPTLGAAFANWRNGIDYNASRYYPPTILSGTWQASSGAMHADTIDYIPFVCRSTHTFTKLAFYNSSSAESGRKFRLGIFDSSNGAPNNLLVDGGETTLGAAAGLNELTISQQLQAGYLYYLAATASAGISGFQIATNYAADSFQDVMSTIDLGIITPSGGVPTGSGAYTQSRAYAALPASASSVAALLFASDNIPMVLLKG